MSSDKHQDPLLKWGHEAAIGIFVVAMVTAILLIIYAAVTEGDITAAMLRGVIVLAVGGGAGFLVLRMRKARERAARPAWMGSTTAWREGIKAKITDENDTPKG